jgi:hypothetical protein
MALQSQGIMAYWSTTTANASGATNVIGGVIGFSGPNLTANVIDITNLRSTAKEKMIGLYDGGSITLNLNFDCDDGGQKLLKECFIARTKGSLQLELSSAATAKQFRMKGYVSGLNITGGVDNVLKSDISIMITGGVSFST